MKKSNVIIFVIVILLILAIFGFAIWNERNDQNNNLGNEQTYNEVTNEVIENDVFTNDTQTNSVELKNNEIQTNTTTPTAYDYRGDWYINQEAYNNAEKIDNLMDRLEDNLITTEEFEAELNTGINNSIVELEVDEYSQNRIKFDFTLTSPAPTQREGKLDDVVVELTENVGTFTYIDNWGTRGNGTITLKDNSIELRLETTSAAQGAMWGVEGIYNFSYRR